MLYYQKLLFNLLCNIEYNRLDHVIYNMLYHDNML